MRHSNEVTDTVLTLCGRSEVCIALELVCLRSALIRMLSKAEAILGEGLEEV
jgi:hypothetical protein